MAGRASTRRTSTSSKAKTAAAKKPAAEKERGFTVYYRDGSSTHVSAASKQDARQQAHRARTVLEVKGMDGNVYETDHPLNMSTDVVRVDEQ